MAGSLLLRMSGLESGYWIDEGIAVGIASHDFARHPVDAGHGRLAAAVLPAAARLDGALRRERGRHPRALAGLRADRRPGRLLGRQRGLRPPHRRARRGRHRRLPVPELLRAGDEDVLARRRPVAAGLGELRARVPARPPRAPGRARRVDDAAALHARVGPLPRRRDGVRVGRAVAPRPGPGPRRAAGRRRGAAALRALDPDADRAGAAHRGAVVGPADGDVPARGSRSPSSATSTAWPRRRCW